MKTGILLVNLGTPDSPSVPDVRKYLREFLSDPRVIDISPAGRWALVNFIIAPIRSPRSAKLYKKIWTDQGSPLLIHSEKQKKLLQEKLGSDYQVELGMRYQNPSIKSALENFSQPIFKKIIVVPLFPQYASASTGSVHELIMSVISKWQVIPNIKFINSFCNDEGFIQAFSEIGKKYQPEKFEHILFSFHGLPERQVHKADCFDHCLPTEQAGLPTGQVGQKDNCCSALGEKNSFCYRAQCFETARCMAQEMNISFEDYTVCFQSRLGRTPWIKPYTDKVIEELAKKGKKKLLVFAPAFVSDCLETIYEIGVEYDLLFKKAGGEKIQMAESLNDHPLWIDALAKLCTN